MARSLHFAAALLLGLVPAWSEQTKEPPKPAPKAPIPVVKAPAKKGPAAKGAAAKGMRKAPPVIRAVPTNPQILRFLRLTPQEREIAIDKMPIPNQEGIRKALANFHWDELPVQERERQLRLYDSVSKLPKDKQDLLNQRIREFHQLPEDRRLGIRGAYQVLSNKTEDERQAIYASQAFKDRFTPAEQQIVVDLVKYYPNPEM